MPKAISLVVHSFVKTGRASMKKNSRREMWTWLSAVAGLGLIAVVLALLAVLWSRTPVASPPATMAPLQITEVAPVTGVINAHNVESQAMYARLNADINAGRRYPSKSGVAPEPAIFQVYDGAPPFDDRLAQLSAPADAQPLVDGEPFVVDESEIRDIAGPQLLEDYRREIGHIRYRDAPPIVLPPDVIHPRPTVSVPEPHPLMLLGFGLLMLGLARWARE